MTVERLKELVKQMIDPKAEHDEDYYADVLGALQELIVWKGGKELDKLNLGGRIIDTELEKLENIFNYCVRNNDCEGCPYDEKCIGADSLAKLGLRLIDEMKLRDLTSKGFFG